MCYIDLRRPTTGKELLMGVEPITARRLRALMHYAPDTGVFTWKVTKGSRAIAGTVAGTVTRNVQKTIPRRRIYVDGRFYWAHRLAFLYMTGSWPEYDVDHINGNPLDNRWSNLRDVPRQINCQNLRRARADSKSGLLGVSWDSSRSRWFACIRHNGKTIGLGRFEDMHEAHEAYLAAKRELHKGCTV